MLLEAHFMRYPYFLGGQPTQADYSIMGALHAHLGRDPAGLRIMQNHAPRTVRWVEQMLLPEVQSPEFYSVDIRLAPNDLIPETALNLLRHLADAYANNFLLGALAWNQVVAERGIDAIAEQLSARDQPIFDPVSIQINQAQFEHAIQVYAEWLAQRSRRFFQALPRG